ncbi:MAG: arginine--tRNA ligase [Micrococcaceae bacterium]
MTPEELSRQIALCLKQAIEDGKIQLEEFPETIKVERPKNREHGDWASNIAMQLTKKANMPPRRIAEILLPYFKSIEGVSEVEVAGPGFINFTLEAASAGAIVETILEQAADFGTADSLKGQKINLEFVSANPTGPIHVGGVRWAAVGDSLARVLQTQGAQVHREYYVNDYGSQIDKFANSLYAAAQGKPTPEDGYAGEYINEIANDIVAQNKGIMQLPEAKAIAEFREQGVQLMLSHIKQSMEDFNVPFDTYFSETTLYEKGSIDKALEKLKHDGLLYEDEGAWWLNTEQFGDDKNRVVIKKDGNPAYIAGDIGYMEDKFNRGYDICFYMLGADHHGYVKRLHAVAQALTGTDDKVEIMIGQLVNLIKDGKPYKMSKRAGNIVTLEDLTELVGVDAARYELVRYSVDSPLDMDLDLLQKKTNDNPVFYVQYAHARTHQVARNAKESGVEAINFDPALLSAPQEEDLLATLSAYPSTLQAAAEFREPHRVARYLEKLAGSYHRWYDVCRVAPKGDEEITDVHRSRLQLNNAAQTVLRNGLNTLGVRAPERM